MTIIEAWVQNIAKNQAINKQKERRKFYCYHFPTIDVVEFHGWVMMVISLRAPFQY
jgi:hypothetical protein